jgi:homoserine dehydrogenase
MSPGTGRPGPAPAASLRTVRLCLLGFGTVAREFCALCARQEHALADDHGLRLLVTAVGTRRGSLLAAEGLAPGAVLEAVGERPAPPQAARPAQELLAASGADVLVENTVTEHDGAPLATAHVLDAFDLGMDVVTANKGPVSWSWPQVSSRAQATGRSIRFESAVMDGLPVFSLLEYALLDCRLLGFEAVFNSTTNFILEALGEGGSFDDALGHAQAEGFAEADPSADVDGWDAACKAAALVNVAMEGDITPLDVERVSLRDVPTERVRAARAAGRRLRLVTSAARDESGVVRVATRATELDIDHPLAAIGAESLGAVLHTDLMGAVQVAELGGMVPQTAYGVYTDLLHVCRTR